MDTYWGPLGNKLCVRSAVGGSFQDAFCRPFLRNERRHLEFNSFGSRGGRISRIICSVTARDRTLLFPPSFANCVNKLQFKDPL